MTTSINLSSIKDNHKHGSVGQFLIDNLKPQADLSIVSAYFTIYAYDHLKTQLEQISHLKFLFGEPTFIKSHDPAKTNKRDFKIVDDQIVIPMSFLNPFPGTVVNIVISTGDTKSYCLASEVKPEEIF